MSNKGLDTWTFADVACGLSASATRRIEREHIMAFIQACGDDNPIHHDEAFAANTKFKRCIAHGFLTGSLISAMFGKIRGAVYLRQSLEFHAPVFVGDEVTTKIQVYALFPEKRRVRFHCTCSVQGKLVLTGDAMLQLPA